MTRSAEAGARCLARPVPAGSSAAAGSDPEERVDGGFCAARALQTAWSFLGRWRDQLDHDLRDDLAQEAVIIAWQTYGSLRDPARVASLVRTIARRVRYRSMAVRRRRTVSFDAEIDPARGHAAVGRDQELEVAGVRVSGRWMLEQLDDVLGVQTPLNRTMLLAYYQGFSCAELAERYGMPQECVKVRLYRSRRLVRREFEVRVGRVVRRRALIGLIESTAEYVRQVDQRRGRGGQPGRKREGEAG